MPLNGPQTHSDKNYTMKYFIHANESKDKVYVFTLTEIGTIQKKYKIIHKDESFRGFSFKTLLMHSDHEIEIED